jgi:quercetin dioxygenase-like cupin family protein
LKAHAPRILSSTKDGRAIALVIPAGESLHDHQVHERALVSIVSGECEITTATGELVGGVPGTTAEFEPGERHAVRALSETRLLLLLTPWPGVGHPGPMSLEAKERAVAHAIEHVAVARRAQTAPAGSATQARANSSTAAQSVKS